MSQPATSDTYGQTSLFEGEKYSNHRANVGAAHSILEAPLRLHEEVTIHATGHVTYIGHDAKGTREHKIEIDHIRVEPAGLRSVPD